MMTRRSHVDVRFLHPLLEALLRLDLLLDPLALHHQDVVDVDLVLHLVDVAPLLDHRKELRRRRL